MSDSSATSAAAFPVINTTKLGGIRRSTRHRKLRGEKALIVSANQTLKELKIQVRTCWIQYWFAAFKMNMKNKWLQHLEDG